MGIDQLARFRRFVRFVRVDPEKTRHRFSKLSWGASLFGGPSLIQTYGGLGAPAEEVVREFRARRARA